MMLWLSRTDLEDEGPPSRKEMFYAVAAAPLLVFQIASWSLRVWYGFRGAPLEVSGLLAINVHWSESQWQFAAGLTMYCVFIAFALLLLWACCLQLQRWLYWRGRA